jgi:Protein of unknown function (DUF998)
MMSALMDIYPYFGLGGSLLITLAIILAALVYSGKAQERYSPFNHFISELGEVGVSRWAVVFNGGLIAGGIILAPFIIGLGLALNNIVGWLGMLAGLWAAVSCLLVGVFPMSNLTPHIKVAVSFFRSALVTILLFSLGILFQSSGQAAIPKLTSLFGLVAVSVYAIFLFLLGKNVSRDARVVNLDPHELSERPRFWHLSILEWLVFVTTILWFLCVAGSLL